MAGEIRRKVTGMFLRASKLLLLIATFALASCDGTLFHEFCAVDDASWSKGDTLLFTYVRPRGNDVTGCELALEVRVDASYKYKNIVTRVQVSKRVPDACEELVAVDTLFCEVYDSKGNPNGSTVGILYQVTSEPLHVDASDSDTLLMRVSHIMECDELQGVYDVGLKLCTSSGHGQHQSSGR